MSILSELLLDIWREFFPPKPQPAAAPKTGDADRWSLFDTCGRCGRKRRLQDEWWDEHISGGGSGFTFNFCNDCDRNHRPECDKIMVDCVVNWRNKCREHWENEKRKAANDRC